MVEEESDGRPFIIGCDEDDIVTTNLQQFYNGFVFAGIAWNELNEAWVTHFRGNRDEEMRRFLVFTNFNFVFMKLQNSFEHFQPPLEAK